MLHSDHQQVASVLPESYRLSAGVQERKLQQCIISQTHNVQSCYGLSASHERRIYQFRFLLTTGWQGLLGLKGCILQLQLCDKHSIHLMPAINSSGLAAMAVQGKKYAVGKEAFPPRCQLKEHF